VSRLTTSSGLLLLLLPQLLLLLLCRAVCSAWRDERSCGAEAAAELLLVLVVLLHELHASRCRVAATAGSVSNAAA